MFKKSDDHFLNEIFHLSKEERANRIRNLDNMRFGLSILAGFLIVLYLISRFDFADSLPGKDTGVPLSALVFIVRLVIIDFEIKFLKFADKLNLKQND